LRDGAKKWRGGPKKWRDGAKKSPKSQFARLFAAVGEWAFAVIHGSYSWRLFMAVSHSLP
jgi:hypothetical protein